MHGYKRARIDLDADTHETIRYFALLRGINVGAVCRKILSEYAARVEGEWPPIRAHMLAWRQAQSNQHPVPYDPARSMGEIEATMADLDEIPF